MSQSLPSLAAFRAAATPPVRNSVRADYAVASAAERATRILIATINPAVGDTGVQTHTRTLHDGLQAAGIECGVVTPFARRALWMPIFGVRKLFAPFNPSWSTRWYRHWHAAALRQALVAELDNDLARRNARGRDARVTEVPVGSALRTDLGGTVRSAEPGTPESCRVGVLAHHRLPPGGQRVGEYAHPTFARSKAVSRNSAAGALTGGIAIPKTAGGGTGGTAVIAQCPVSAGVALDVRERLGLDFPIAMVCHFNFSEAREYRDKGELPNETAYQAILDFEQRVLGSVDRVIYVSSWAKRIVEEERRISVRSSSVIWNGIAADGPAAISRAEIGVEPGDLVLMNVGTLERRKNQLGLIDLFAAVAQKCDNARLVLVGEGPQRTDIRNRIAERGLGGKVRMLGMRRDVPALLAAADLYVHFAAMENCPVVLLEAARAGLPIAAVPAGGVPELLAILGGVTLDSSDMALSLSNLQPLLEQDTGRRRAGQAARAAFERTFTRQAMVAAYLNSLADSSAGPREVTA